MPARQLKTHKTAHSAFNAFEQAAENIRDDMQNVTETTSTDMGDEEEDEIDSSSSFSLQECIDEFRARRIRRNSNQEQQQQQHQETENLEKTDDVDLINQNRSNKEQERKCKPCKNGFCYCFTSDSGDGGGCGGALASSNAARAAQHQIRHARRSRKSESGQQTIFVQPATVTNNNNKKTRKSAPACLKTMPPPPPIKETVENREIRSPSKHSHVNAHRQLTAISRLETTSYDAPLIHIIQELRDNCVVSEVRVNKHKLQSPPTKVLKSPSKNAEKAKEIHRKPKRTSIDDNTEDCKSTVLEMPSGDKIPVTRLEVITKNPQRKSAGGRLLQKRLSHTNLRYKPRDMTAPPPKPPRASTGSILKSSSSAVSSTSPSIREAERIVDDFLKKKGVPIPKAAVDTHDVRTKSNKKRMSFPFTHIEEETHIKNHMPSCPSLSDIERVVDSKPRSYYGKNIQQKSEQQHIKDISFGWKEPKVSEMLNYDTNGNRKDFKTQAGNAEPQSIGWHAPPKLELDTVDGAVRHNLASNVAPKGTPVKLQFNPMRKETNRKFGWRNLSPWPSMSAHGARIRRCPKSTTTFLKQSKKKILRLVTPKKNNKEPLTIASQRYKVPTPYRTVGIQTSPQDFVDCYENSTTPLSPPGSYHSANQVTTTPQDSLTTTTTTTTGQQTRSNNQSDPVEFDFSRTVSSPSRKATRTTQRKLSFASGCVHTTTCFDINSELSRGPTTYRSYNTDFDKEVNISKMGCILSNIRARLEASDEQAVRTFEEIERREQLEQGFDCPDSFGIRQRTCVDIHSNIHNHSSLIQNEPIYSEIEEDSIRVTESPQFDNKTGIESSSSGAVIDLENLYAKVKKPPKNVASMPLGKLLHDSLRQQRIQAVHRLPVLQEPSLSDVSYTSPTFETSTQRSSTPTISHCQSLNNIRVMEHKSPPKRNRNLSKSDLSLQRSEIFLENLCRSELIVEGETLERLEKIDNHALNRTTETQVSDNVSYALPDETDKNTASNVLAEKTPKDATTNTTQQKFLTKNTLDTQNTQPLTSTPNFIETQLANRQRNRHDSQCSSCPVTPRKITNSEREVMQSNSQPDHLNVSKYELMSTLPQPVGETGLTASASAHYKRLKQALQNSFRKSRNFVKTKRSPTPYPKAPAVATILEPQQTTLNTTEASSQAGESCLNLDALFALDEATTVAEQLARAVSICRQLPELETSREMVEAERLLLFSTLQQDTRIQVQLRRNVEDAYPRQFSIETMNLPVKFETNLESYFNYYFIVTFESEGKIQSTQSTVCRHGQAVFQDCNIEFKTQKYHDDIEPVINCNIFLLRLRKVSQAANLSTEIQDLSTYHDISPLSSTPFGSLTSLNGVTSRFRLYASFTLNARTFAPYSLIETETSQPNRICLRAAGNCYVPLKLCASQTQISLNACVMIDLPGFKYSGFLHVQDPFSMHNWNWRWCNLTGLQIQIWADMTGINEQPLLRLNLNGIRQSLPLQSCSRELCARARSFCLKCSTRKIGFDCETATIFFAADNEEDLKQWIQHLNEVLEFIATWMQ